MNDRPPPTQTQEAVGPIVRKFDGAVIWPDGTVREARIGFAYCTADPLAVLLRVAAHRAEGTGILAGNLTLARDFLGDLVRNGEAKPPGGVVSAHTAGENTYCLTLHLTGGNVEFFFPIVELARFLAATERACPAGSVMEHGTIVADLIGFLDATTRPIL